MKTYHEYEAADIDFDAKDPVMGFLMAQIFVIGLTGFKSLPEDGDDKMLPIKRLIAGFLNAAQREGLTFAKTENVPDVYKSVAGG